MRAHELEPSLNDPHYQFHLSVEPHLISGKPFSEQTRTISFHGERGDAMEDGKGIYTTRNLIYWATQLSYENIGNFPEYVYLVYVTSPSKGSIETAHQDLSDPSDVIVLAQIDRIDSDSDDVPDYGKMIWKADNWIKNHR